MKNCLFASQSQEWLLKNCHCERVGMLDLTEMGFEGEPETWLDWFHDARRMERYQDRFDFINLAAQCASWADSRISIEPDDDEEFRDPVGTVDPVADHGVLGELLRQVQPFTEANGLFILCHLLSMCGCDGQIPSHRQGPGYSYESEFRIAWPSAKARKRTALRVAELILQHIDRPFADSNVVTGLSSGRGLLEHLRDESRKLGPKGKEVHDKGVPDKRRVFIEEEPAVGSQAGTQGERALVVSRSPIRRWE